VRLFGVALGTGFDPPSNTLLRSATDGRGELISTSTGREANNSNTFRPPQSVLKRTPVELPFAVIARNLELLSEADVRACLSLRMLSVRAFGRLFKRR